MLYCSLDLETTGISFDSCQILEVAAVVDNLADPKPLADLPRLHFYVRYPVVRGEPQALVMHVNLLETIARGEVENILEEDCVWPTLEWFLRTQFPGRVVAAGKNFAAFDLNFLRRLDGFVEGYFHHRVLDPAMLFLKETDEVPPSTEECCRRAGIEVKGRHTAMEDALTVIKLLRIGLDRQRNCS